MPLASRGQRIYLWVVPSCHQEQILSSFDAQTCHVASLVPPLWHLPNDLGTILGNWEHEKGTFEV